MSIEAEKQKSPVEALRKYAEKFQVNVLGKQFALHMDEIDPLKEFRKRFTHPKKVNLEGVDKDLVTDPEEECVYLCGNSLGLKPKTTDAYVLNSLTAWGNTGAQTHFTGDLPAALCDLYGRESMGRLVGAEPSEVILMNGLTVNLHLLLISFYQPSGCRFKIVLEKHAFPSDRYAMRSQAAMRGYDPNTAVFEISPREGEDLIRTEDILKLLETEGESISVLCLSGVQYYTGQKFDMKYITAEAQKRGILVGWDLAHAIGNVRLELDNWGVDFACWCTYKYLNSGPGCIGGAYVNKKHNERKAANLHGWWSNKKETRFEMRDECDYADGVERFRLCNPPPVLVACVLASLEIFDEAGMDRLLEKQFLLTGYFEYLIESTLANIKKEEIKNEKARKSGQLENEGKSERAKQENIIPFVRVITPKDPAERGCQISMDFSIDLETVHTEFTRRGIVCDLRLPSVIRLAPIPLYNSFQDVYTFVSTLREVILEFL